MRNANNLTTFMCRLSRNLGASNACNPQKLSRPLMGLLLFFIYLFHKIRRGPFCLLSSRLLHHHHYHHHHHHLLLLLLILLLLPLALQPAVGFGLSNNVLPFFPICHQLSPSSHSQNLKISFYFLFPSFPGSSPSSRPFQDLSEDVFRHPILLHSL